MYARVFALYLFSSACDVAHYIHAYIKEKKNDIYIHIRTVLFAHFLLLKIKMLYFFFC